MKLTFRNCCAHCKCIHDIQNEVQKSCLIYFFDWLHIGNSFTVCNVHRFTAETLEEWSSTATLFHYFIRIYMLHSVVILVRFVSAVGR